MNRRDFFRLASAAGIGASAISWACLASAATPAQLGTVPSNTGIKGRVVVIGGGMAGATVAKYLRLWGGTGIAVTLVERETAYTSNILSNLVLNGQRTIASLQFGYTNLASRYGVGLVKGDVVAIDSVGHSITLADGRKIPYDRLVVAPGIEFDTIAGLELPAAQAKVPHAWQAGPQTTQLRNMLTAMKPGEVFAMTIPAKPYRCPPGPYERACVVADWLKTNRPGSKVIVLDANPGIIAEPLAFANAFDVVHKGVIEYHPGVSISSIDATTMSLNTSLGNLKANVINAIPAHKAGKVVTGNGLANVAGRWAGVDVLTYQSTAAPGIHVIGDSAATTQPKAGHIANQEAKICADAIVRLLAGRSPDPSPITNSACYSPITATTASWLTAVFAYDPVSASMQPVPGAAGEAAGRSTENYKEMVKWFNTLMEDSFA